jgi:hypothetical protein
MNTFGLQPTDIYTTCHTYQCYNQADHLLGKPDSPNGTVYYICGQCAQELRDNVVKAIEPPKLPFEPETADFKAYEDMSYAELKAFAKKIGVTGYNNKSAADIIKLIEAETAIHFEVD